MATLPSPVARPLPGVSAIIPAFNYAGYLPQAIDSVLQQDYPEFEIIVVDDGSTDNTAEVVAAYVRRDRRVRYVHQKNAGLSAARNTGIQAARFDYVAFLDADDEWLREFLRRNMETFAAQPPEFAIVACRPVFVDADGATLEVKRLASEAPREITCRDLIFKNHFPCTVVVKKSAFAECGKFDETLRSSEDRDMWVRIAATRRVFLLGERLVRIRRHAVNMSRHAGRMKANTRRVIVKAHRARLVPRNHLPFWLRVLSFFYFQTAWTYYGESRRTGAIGYLALSVALWPWFGRPRRFNEPALFRLRSLVRFLRYPDPDRAPGKDHAGPISIPKRA